jgi:molecular chaperone DnaK
MGIAVGIDLGTTNTVVAAVRDGVAGPLPDPQGDHLLPSVVSFHPSGATLVGRSALERRLVDAKNTIYSVKRLIGLPWDSPEVRASCAKLPFMLQEGANGGAVVAVRGERYSLPEISAFVLRHAKAVAEAALGEPVTRAVVTVPANFNDLQRAATKMAAKLAGLEVLRILNEPTAAALAYGPPNKARERVAIYDLGGGTFDVTVLDLAGSVFEVLATAGDTALGGDDIDVLLAERMADDLLKRHRFDARAQPAVFGRLRLLAEAMKRELSTREEHTVSADDLVPGDRGGVTPWRFRATRPELEWASLALIERTFSVCQQALDSAGTQPAMLERVILVGGAARMPLVARKVEQFFGRPPVMRINPEEVVALGAAIQAALLDRTQQTSPGPMSHPQIAEVSVVALPPEEPAVTGNFPSLPLVGAREGAPAPAPSASFLPGATSKPLVFDVPQRNAAPGATPNDAAPSARIPPPLPGRARAQTMVLPFGLGMETAPSSSSPASPPRSPSLLIDVTPLNLGVETAGGFCDVLIEANTPVPCDKTRTFTTASDAQTVVMIRVAQGKSERFAENTLLGELELSGMAPAPRGETQIAVTFEIDADGILQVRARDVKTRQETAARMQLVGGSSDIEAMRARQAAHPLPPLGQER